MICEVRKDEPVVQSAKNKIPKIKLNSPDSLLTPKELQGLMEEAERRDRVLHLDEKGIFDNRCNVDKSILKDRKKNDIQLKHNSREERLVMPKLSESNMNPGLDLADLRGQLNRGEMLDALSRRSSSLTEIIPAMKSSRLYSLDGGRQSKHNFSKN